MLQISRAHVNMQCRQHADDMPLYVHFKPSNLQSYKCDLNKSLCNLVEWSSNADLVINPSKTKLVLRNVKNLLPFHIRKNLAQAPVLSKLYYNDILHYSPPEYLTARLHRVQKAAASFVNGKYATTLDILKLNWFIPVTEQREWHILKSTHKSLYSSDCPNYLRLESYENNRN